MHEDGIPTSAQYHDETLLTSPCGRIVYLPLCVVASLKSSMSFIFVIHSSLVRRVQTIGGTHQSLTDRLTDPYCWS